MGVFKTRNGEMTKWRNDEMELKTRATVIKYDRSTEISICCRIYFVVFMYGKKSICLSRIYRQAVAMTLCFELQQSHEMDYVLRDEVYTRYLANTYFARKRSDVGVYIK